MRSASLLAYLALALTVTVAEPVSAQDKPRPGGELIFVVPAEPPSFDAHREETFGMLHPGAQITPSHYLNNQLDTVWLSE
jgi:peptide/nickel transport system substrate-binding protein